MERKLLDGCSRMEEEEEEEEEEGRSGDVLSLKSYQKKKMSSVAAEVKLAQELPMIIGSRCK
jgi:hypothetical protein